MSGTHSPSFDSQERRGQIRKVRGSIFRKQALIRALKRTMEVTKAQLAKDIDKETRLVGDFRLAAFGAFGAANSLTQSATCAYLDEDTKKGVYRAQDNANQAGKKLMSVYRELSDSTIEPETRGEECIRCADSFETEESTAVPYLMSDCADCGPRVLACEDCAKDFPKDFKCIICHKPVTVRTLDGKLFEAPAPAIPPPSDDEVNQEAIQELQRRDNEHDRRRMRLMRRLRIPPPPAPVPAPAAATAAAAPAAEPEEPESQGDVIEYVVLEGTVADSDPEEEDEDDETWTPTHGPMPPFARNRRLTVRPMRS